MLYHRLDVCPQAPLVVDDCTLAYSCCQGSTHQLGADLSCCRFDTASGRIDGCLLSNRQSFSAEARINILAVACSSILFWPL